jgi:GxxExxY protein
MSVAKHVELAEALLTHSIIGAFFAVYNTLGYGFLESVYVAALTLELKDRDHRVEREVDVRVNYKNREIARQRIDMLVDRRVVVEVKAGPAMAVSAQRQLRNYLRATELEVGLLLYFGPRPQFSREFAPNQSTATSYSSHSDLPTDPG